MATKKSKAKQKKRKLLPIEIAFKEFPAWFRKRDRALQEKAELIKRFAKLPKDLEKWEIDLPEDLKSPPNKSKEKRDPQPHPWRQCDYGRHWVRQHTRRTKKGITTVRAHCADNPTHKDHLYKDEIKYIAEHYSKQADIPQPCKNNLGYKLWNVTIDQYTALWTKYWNDVFSFKDPIDPNLVKALVATESSFNSNVAPVRVSKGNFARGLMQVTDESRAIMGDVKGELRDQYVHVTDKDMRDPQLNICAGIRWLIRKREIASARLKRPATWEEAVADYKSYAKDWVKNPNHEQKLTFERLYKRLRECKT